MPISENWLEEPVRRWPCNRLTLQRAPKNALTHPRNVTYLPRCSVSSVGVRLLGDLLLCAKKLQTAINQSTAVTRNKYFNSVNHRVDRKLHSTTLFESEGRTIFRPRPPLPQLLVVKKCVFYRRNICSFGTILSFSALTLLVWLRSLRKSSPKWPIVCRTGL